MLGIWQKATSKDAYTGSRGSIASMTSTSAQYHQKAAVRKWRPTGAAAVEHRSTDW